jgi:hypothetical protein
LELVQKFVGPLGFDDPQVLRSNLERRAQRAQHVAKHTRATFPRLPQEHDQNFSRLHLRNKVNSSVRSRIDLGWSFHTMYGVKVWGFRSGFPRTRQHPLNFTCSGRQGPRGPGTLTYYTARKQYNFTIIARIARCCVGMLSWV